MTDLSLINGQVVSVEQLITPQGINIATNISPSLLPIQGSLAYDYTTPGVLYVGNGAIWKNVGTSSYVELDILNITLNCSGADNDLSADMDLQQVNSGTISITNFTITINQTIATTGAETWDSAAGTIPIPFRPSSDKIFPVILNSASSFNSTNGYLQLKSDGSITLGITAPAGMGPDTGFSNFSGSY
jgi:hypothetical protein